jgi:hypothetical protein
MVADADLARSRRRSVSSESALMGKQRNQSSHGDIAGRVSTSTVESEIYGRCDRAGGLEQ